MNTRRQRRLTGASTIMVLAAAARLSSAPAIGADPAAESRRLRAEGLQAGYNLDHAAALEAFRAAIAADPTDPAPHRLTAATLWIEMLFRQGAVTADDYLGQARTQVRKPSPPPDVDAAFRTHLARALSLAGDRLRRDPRDPDAHFQAGAAHSFLATYIATVEGRNVAGFRAARRAYLEHEKVLELDPLREDAGLVVGLYRYGVSTLPVHWRLLAGLAGFRGGRDRGLRMIAEAAASPSDVQPNALFTLIVIYNREQQFDRALEVIGELQRRYPRNRLLWLEAASTNLRAGRALAARSALEQGLAKLAADPRPRAFGEEARWRYACGATLVALGATDAAARELRAVLSGEAHEWLRGRAHAELGKLADLGGDRLRAADEYRTAMRIARAENDQVSYEAAAALLRAGYRRPEGGR
jgi:hypothetical protein